MHGDKNSKYFHSRATQRHRKNSIYKIRNSNGRWCSNLKEMANTLGDFYRELFTSIPLTGLMVQSIPSSISLRMMMVEIVSKPHDTHMLDAIPAKQKQEKTLGEYQCGTGQRPSEG